jgi:hypothetical protein
LLLYSRDRGPSTGQPTYTFLQNIQCAREIATMFFLKFFSVFLLVLILCILITCVHLIIALYSNRKRRVLAKSLASNVNNVDFWKNKLELYITGVWIFITFDYSTFYAPLVTMQSKVWIDWTLLCMLFILSLNLKKSTFKKLIFLYVWVWCVWVCQTEEKNSFIKYSFYN